MPPTDSTLIYLTRFISRMPVNFYVPLCYIPPSPAPTMLYDGHGRDKILCFGSRLLLLELEQMSGKFGDCQLELFFKFRIGCSQHVRSTARIQCSHSKLLTAVFWIPTRSNFQMNTWKLSIDLLGRQTAIQSYTSADCSTKVTGTFTAAIKSKKNSNFTYGNNNFLFYNFASLITILFCWWCN